VVATQLAAVLDAGVRLRFAPDPTRPIFHAPDPGLRAQLAGLLTPETKPTTQALLHHAVRYRDVLRALFRGIAEPATVDDITARAWLNTERRCVDELGVALAEAVRAQVVESWTAETRLCPWCGGAQHPEDTDR
jgi:hypothetical protein